MKTIRCFLIILALCLCLTACSTPAPDTDTTTDTTLDSTQDSTQDTTEDLPVPEDVYEEGAALAGVDLTGLTLDEAMDAVAAYLPTYEFTLLANDVPLTFTAEELGVQLDTDTLLAYLTALQNGEELPDAPLATCQSEVVVSKVRSELQRGAGNPAIVFSKQENQFVINKGWQGRNINTDGVAQAVSSAVGKLADNVTATLNYSYYDPAIADDDPRLPVAQAEANSYLVHDLAYCFEAEGIQRTEVPVTLAEQSSFISIDKDYVVSIDDKALQAYADKMADTLVYNAQTDAFITSTGYSLPAYQVQYHTVTLDKAHFVNDLITCIKTHTGGLRNALLTVNGSSNMAYGGTYVEVSIDDQHLWYYKDGELIVSCDVVTGRVSNGWNSKTGIFQVNNKMRYVSLVGDDYVTPVDYWIPYIGGAVGLHDALWHDTFGGDKFIYQGTHGCINMPYDAVVTVYEHITIGTHVIVYGNTRSLVKQEFTGPTSYTVENGSDPFKLDLGAKYEKTPFTYTSSNTNVVTVSEDGTITVVGTGTATITVKSGTWWNVLAGKFQTTITVVEPEPEPEPEPDPVPNPEPEPEPEPDPVPDPDPEQPENTPEAE